jgi:hypothetical protein
MRFLYALLTSRSHPCRSTKIIEAPEVIQIAAEMPSLKTLYDSLYNTRYDHFFQALGTRLSSVESLFTRSDRIRIYPLPRSRSGTEIPSTVPDTVGPHPLLRARDADKGLLAAFGELSERDDAELLQRLWCRGVFHRCVSPSIHSPRAKADKGLDSILTVPGLRWVITGIFPASLPLADCIAPSTRSTASWRLADRTPRTPCTDRW